MENAVRKALGRMNYWKYGEFIDFCSRACVIEFKHGAFE